MRDAQVGREDRRIDPPEERNREPPAARDAKDDIHVYTRAEEAHRQCLLDRVVVSRDVDAGLDVHGDSNCDEKDDDAQLCDEASVRSSTLPFIHNRYSSKWDS